MNKKQSDKPYHHGDLRKALIQTALKMLSKKGSGDLSLRELAREIGVGHNAPYRHFKNKTDLLEALAAHGFYILTSTTNDAIAKHPNDPEQQLFETGFSLIYLAINQPELFNMMFGGIVSLHQCGSELRTAANNAIGCLVQIVAAGQKAGIFREGDTMALTLAAMSMVHGLAVMITNRILPDTKVLTHKAELIMLTRQMYEIFLTGLKKR